MRNEDQDDFDSLPLVNIGGHSMTTDFYRPVYCILGLPFDAVTLKKTVANVLQAKHSKQPFLLATPNVNYLINSLRDENFRDSVIRSNLSIADGMPLVWIARVLGIPIPERVAGSNMFELLERENGQPIAVYFFGGANGVAKEACEKLNSVPSGLVCVGHHSPGFGSIEDMSSSDVIQSINRSEADFLVIALGAKKGQAWIEHNLGRLRVPLISHLGAVINFVAGTITRAPVWVQKLGLEWLWRIKEEPMLWRRYLGDGLFFLKLLPTRALPAAIYERWRLPDTKDFADAEVTLAREDGLCKITLSGAWGAQNLLQLREAFVAATQSTCDIRIELVKLVYGDSAFIGLLMLLYGHQSKIAKEFSIFGLSSNMLKRIRFNCAEFLLNPLVVQKS